MTRETTWLVVADGAGARLFEIVGGGGLDREPRATLRADTAPSREIASDRPGRTFDSAGAHRHAKEPPSDPHRYEKRRFAQALAEHLENAVARGAVDRLVVVAPPPFLGDLRAAASATLKARVVSDVDKDLTHLPAYELERHLAHELRAAVKPPLR